MKALSILVLLLFNLSLFAQENESRKPAAPVEDDHETNYNDESDSLLQENDELRAEVDRLQSECNCEEEQREEYVSEREESPVVIINQIPPIEPVQQEVTPTPPAAIPQFNNSQYENNSQFVIPGAQNTPPGVNYVPMDQQK